MNERAKCPKCGAKYDMISEAASKAIDRLCAVCWSDRHERNIREGREQEVEGKQTSQVDRKFVSSN